MSTLSSAMTFSIQAESGNRYTTSSTFTDDVLYAYVQEYQITGAENEVIFDMADDPNYSDFVLLRIEVLDFGNGADGIYVKITSGSDSCYLPIGRALPIMEIPGVNLWTAQSDSGSPDTIDEITLMGAGDANTGPGLSNPIQVRITAYCVAS